MGFFSENVGYSKIDGLRKMLSGIKTLQDFDLSGKKILVRIDLNVPILHGKIVDYSRIERIIPTVKYLIKNQAKVILLSHFSRPKGRFVLDMSLAPIVDAVARFLPDVKVKFAVDCIGPSAKKSVSDLKEGEVLVIENLRFHSEEEANDENFARELADLGDIFVNDSFSSSHRSHASIVGIPKYLPSSIGFLFAEEIKRISQILANPAKPFAAIIGGSKISTKLSLLLNLVTKTEAMIIGGGMANSFLKARGINIGQSFFEPNLIDSAKEILEKAEKYNCKVILPEDVVVASDLVNPVDCEIVDINSVPEKKMIFDIGPASCAKIFLELKNYKTIVWNGPVGAFEYRPFNVSSEYLARAIAFYTKQKKLCSVAGGGDVLASLKASGVSEAFSYLSTAGGAFLEWLEGKEMPGLIALRTAPKNS